MPTYAYRIPIVNALQWAGDNVKEFEEFFPFGSILNIKIGKFRDTIKITDDKKIVKIPGSEQKILVVSIAAGRQDFTVEEKYYVVYNRFINSFTIYNPRDFNAIFKEVE